ncbi:hypothetical protein E3E27_07655 [Thermococcus sp. MV11]|nr:hypothetical protein [Thermococcus sp. MV11]
MVEVRNIMVQRKQVTFLTITLISLLLTSIALRPAIIKAPPETKSIEELLSPKLPPGNETNETGPPGEPNLVLLVSGAAHTHYLRLNVYTDYEAGRWVTRNATAVQRNVIAPPEITVPHHAERDNVTVISFTPLTGNLFTSLYTTRVEGAGAEVVPEYNLFRTGLRVSSYSFSSVSYTFDWPHLVNLTAGNQSIYLSAPNDTRLESLARGITLGSLSDYEKAVRIARYLAENYRVEDDVAPPEGTDRLRWFLLDSKAGTPYDFATAFVILARLNDLPARLVEGLYIEAIPQTQVVTEKNRHFWAEVYFNGAGWLVFDPLHPDPNVYTPFELSIRGVPPILEPNGTGTLGIMFERVASESGARVEVKAPEVGVIALINESGIHNVTIGPFWKPGYYPIIVNASTERGESIVRFAQVLVPGELSARPNRTAVNLLKSGSEEVEITVYGTGKIDLETDSRLVESWSAIETVRNETKIYVRLNAPADYPNGLHVEKLVVTKDGQKFPVYLPVIVVERTEVKANVPKTLTAGEFLNLTGEVITPTGERPTRGKAAAFISDGNRMILLGVSNVSNGTFSVFARIPPYLEPGTGQVMLYYIAPIGYPYLPGGNVVTVRIRGLSRFSLSGPILTRPGNVTIVGTLRDGAGRPIANASVNYYLDGRPLGGTKTLTSGGFSLRLYLPEVGRHVLTLEHPGSKDYAPSVLNVTVAAVELELPREVEAGPGEPVKISGRVIGIEDAVIEAYVFPEKTYTASVANGSFSLTLEPFQAVGEKSVEFRQGARVLGRTAVKVVSPLRIEALTKRAEGEEKARVELKVTDVLDEPVEGIQLEVKAGNFSTLALTNGSGIATVYLPVSDEETNETVTVVFRGSTYYLPTRAELHIVLSREKSFPWPYLVVLAIVGVLAGKYWLGRTRREETSGRTVKIIFRDGLPLFRKGEEIELEVECGGEAELRVDGKPLGRGRRFRLDLPPGRHEIEAICGNEIERTAVRVVPSYGKVVVEDYERCFLPWARKAGLNVEELTPREIAKALKDMMYPWEPINVVTETLERVKYGGGEVTREEFIRFHRAMLELTGGECVV